MMTRTTIFDKEMPAIVINPKNDSSQTINRTEAIILNGFGKMPISQTIARKIRRLYSVIVTPENENRTILARGRKGKLMKPKNQSATRTKSTAPIIFLFYHFVSTKSFL